MQDRLIKFETAKLAQEKGYPIQLYGNKDKFLYSMFELQRWLFEEHSIWVQATPLFSSNEMMGVNTTITSWKFTPILIDSLDGFDVYKSLEEGLFHALKLI